MDSRGGRDDGKEFCNKEFKEMCSEFGIRHRVVGVESHGSNGGWIQ